MSRRTDRVAEAVQALVAELLVREIKDPRIGLVTITGVKMTPDLRHARVFVSVLGNPGERRRSLQALDRAHGFLQRRVAGELRLKHTPTLEFAYDDSSERGMRIAEILEGEDRA